jgi:DNA mismatch endonuclease (patch repair protein)
MTLRRALYRRGLRYRVARAELPGRPDIVFSRARVAIFCDGDFWHGRELSRRLQKLNRGHNAAYWLAKIQRNVARDRSTDAKLVELGWLVLRYWESDIRRDAEAIASAIERVVREAGSPRGADFKR